MGLSLWRVRVKDQRHESRLREEKIAERIWRDGRGGMVSDTEAGVDDGCSVMVVEI